MNNTIDFKTAKTIDSMSKKLDHIDDAVTGFFSIMHMAMKNELGSAEPYFAATSPVLDLTVIRPDDILVGDYYIPDLKLPEEHRLIGKYGRLHREYLREVHPVRLNTLILTGELWTYLADLNEQAQERLDTIMEQMKTAEGVTEELKRTSQMEWVQRCNNIHNRAEEIVLHEMIYCGRMIMTN